MICKVPDCGLACINSSHGFELPVCEDHAARLPLKLVTRTARAAAGSPFDPDAVLEAAEIVVRIKKFFGRAPKKKAKRKS